MNMNYCRFENTLDALRDCYNHMADDSDMSNEEATARRVLISLCARIVMDFGANNEPIQIQNREGIPQEQK